jgi:hypothetical protein
MKTNTGVEVKLHVFLLGTSFMLRKIYPRGKDLIPIGQKAW